MFIFILNEYSFIYRYYNLKQKSKQIFETVKKISVTILTISI